MTSRTSARLASAAIVVVAVGIWEGVVRFGLVSFDTIPSASATAKGMADVVRSGELASSVLHTLQVFAMAFALAAVAGLVLGTLIGISKTCYSYLHAFLEFLRFVPPPAIIPLVLIIAGFTPRSELLIAAFASLWPVLLNTADGVEAIDPQLREVGHSLCMGRVQMFFKLVMPAALPTIAVGLRLALSLCLIIVITTEIVAIRAGVGFALVSASSALRPNEVYAYIFVIGGLGLLLNLAFRLFERRVLLRGWVLS